MPMLSGEFWPDLKAWLGIKDEDGDVIACTIRLRAGELARVTVERYLPDCSLRTTTQEYRLVALEDVQGLSEDESVSREMFHGGGRQGTDSEGE